jgi:tripartite-type tricarboxylate transporter receptor subunit TctC
MGGKLVAHVACEKCPISAAQPRHAFDSSRVGRVDLTGIRSVKKTRRDDGHIHRWYLCAMILVRRSLAGMVVAAVLLPTVPGAPAQDYPNRPIRLVVGFTPGGTTDFVARLLSEPLRGLLGQNVLVDNRPGANGAIAAEYVAKSEPDGYTLFFTTVGAVAINPALRGNLAYDPRKDFAPVGMAVFNSTILVVNASMNVNSARELAALARKRPGAITIAITGLGAISHLGLELFQAAAGVKFQAVPYRGASKAITDLLGGQLDGLFGDTPTVMEQVKAGKLKALAATSQDRSDIFRDVPTFVEQGFADTIASQWAGTLAPAGTPRAVIARLNAAFNAALSDVDVRRKLAQAGVTPSPSTPEEFAHYLEQEIARWSRLIRDKGIKGE